MTHIVVHAPFRGWVRSLDDVPDAAFSGRMVGEGVAVDPLDCELRAPCAATVVAVAPTGHSVTLRTGDGIDLLLHVGIDTVKLDGNGFTLATAPGAKVDMGDLLISFDPDVIARSAVSLVTPVVVTNPKAVTVILAEPGPIEAGGPLFSVSLAAASVSTVAGEGGNILTRTVRLALPNGIHARPAAQIVRTARQFDCEITLNTGDKSASAGSLSALLALGAGSGDEFTLHARGVEAAVGVAALENLLLHGLHEAGEQPECASHAAVQPATLSASQFAGVKAAPGLAIGPVVRIARSKNMLDAVAGDAATETAALARAIDEVAMNLQVRADGHGRAAVAIAHAHVEMIRDEHLRETAHQLILAGQSAAAAWRGACRMEAAALLSGNNARLAERAADYRDIERQVLQALEGGASDCGYALTEGNSIIVADELLPSEFLELDHARVGGICTARGGATSHVAILAAARGLPMLVAVGAGIADLPDGRIVIVDADGGFLETSPTAMQLAAGAARMERQVAAAGADAVAAQVDCVMADGTRIEVFANLGSVGEARAAVAAGAEGCGLLRTEFLFLDRASAPDEQTQVDAYAAIAAALQGRPLIVRTLDIGGDKPVPYLPFPPEENPALGARGIRHSLANPTLFETQLRAILRGVPGAQCRIMLPMVVEVDEVRAVRQMLDRLCTELGLAYHVPLGVMIETPAAALLAETLAEEADFLSVGSNDLTQYTLAMDRSNPQLAARADACHPAVLRLITEAARGAARHGCWLGLCGGLASDPDAAALLVGLGVTELSVTPAAVPTIKARLRGLSRPACLQLAERALDASSAGQVRRMLQGHRP